MTRLNLKRRVAFSAAHAYWNPDLTEAENKSRFGAWASPWGHGHNYTVEVVVSGEVDPRDGMVVNIVDVDRVLKQQILFALADKHLNYDVPHFAKTTPTLENIARYISEKFTESFTDPKAMLDRVTVWEMPTLWVTLEKNNPMIQLTRSLDFAASHRLHAPALTDAENLAVFGKCNNIAGHGHNYGVEVTVIGEPDATTGMLVDLAALDFILEQEIMQRYDHKNLNNDVADFKNSNPTSENLTIAIFEHLKDKIPKPAALYKVVVKETDRNYFEYYGH
jgi:6-pyruvoyltetrahydropterin/6-carboxytetrahydropterin synthase